MALSPELIQLPHLESERKRLQSARSRYNPNVPADELHTALARARAGLITYELA
jgi:hypothetical protein